MSIAQNFCEYIKTHSFTLVQDHLGVAHCQIKSVLSGETLQVQYILKHRLTNNGDLETCLILPPPQWNNAKTVPDHDSIHTPVASCDWVETKSCLSVQLTAILGLGSPLR